MTLCVSSVSLENFDLVPVGVLDEEELRHQNSIAMKLLDGSGVEPCLGNSRMFAVNILYRYVSTKMRQGWSGFREEQAR